MKPLPPNAGAFRQAAAVLLDCYREPPTRACQRVLLILANKNGSASPEEAGRAVRLPRALEAQVFTAAFGPLIDLGLILPSNRPGAPAPPAR